MQLRDVFILTDRNVSPPDITVCYYTALLQRVAGIFYGVGDDDGFVAFEGTGRGAIFGDAFHGDDQRAVYILRCRDDVADAQTQ